MAATPAVPDMRLELVPSRYRTSTGRRNSTSRLDLAICTTPRSPRLCGWCS